MAIKKSDLYSSIWASCDELRGGMDASQYKGYVLFMLFVKYISDKYGNSDENKGIINGSLLGKDHSGRETWYFRFRPYGKCGLCGALYRWDVAGGPGIFSFPIKGDRCACCTPRPRQDISGFSEKM